MRKQLILCAVLIAAQSLFFMSCHDTGDIPYQPHLPISESLPFEGYKFLSVDVSDEWTWITDEDNLKEISYPVSHEEHPSYKNMEVYGTLIVEKKGDLKFVRHPLIDSYQYPSLLQSIEIPTSYIDIVKAVKAYRENRYDIKDDPDAEYLEWMLGLRKDLGKSKRKGNPIVDVFQSEMDDFVNSVLCLSISNWLEQISRDEVSSQEECKYLYCIRRHDETSFDYIYLDSDGKSSYTIRESYEWDFDMNDINNVGSLAKLYDAVKHTKRYKLVDNPEPIAIDLNIKKDTVFHDGNEKEEAILAYKFNKTYTNPDGWVGFKKSIYKIIHEMLIQHYEESCMDYLSKYMGIQSSDKFYDGIHLFDFALDQEIKWRSHFDLDLDSLYQTPLSYNSETGELRILGEYGMLPELFKGDVRPLSMKVYISVNGEQISGIQIDEADNGGTGLGPAVIRYHGIEIENKTLENAIKKKIKLSPTKKGIISFLTFPIRMGVSSSYVDQYLETLQNSARISIKELQKSMKRKEKISFDEF